MKLGLGESKEAPFPKDGESREVVVGLAAIGERTELVQGACVDVEEVFPPQGESCSKLGGECDSTGVLPFPGVEELSGFSIRVGLLEAFLEGVQGPDCRGLLGNFWQVLEGDGWRRGISTDS